MNEYRMLSVSSSLLLCGVDVVVVVTVAVHAKEAGGLKQVQPAVIQ
jgi:hypothetical protein